jgi:hypothetical protein
MNIYDYKILIHQKNNTQKTKTNYKKMNVYEFNYLNLTPPPKKNKATINHKKNQRIKKTGEKFGLINFPQNALKLPLIGNPHYAPT